MRVANELDRNRMNISFPSRPIFSLTDTYIISLCCVPSEKMNRFLFAYFFRFPYRDRTAFRALTREITHVSQIFRRKDSYFMQISGNFFCNSTPPWISRMCLVSRKSCVCILHICFFYSVLLTSVTLVTMTCLIVYHFNIPRYVSIETYVFYAYYWCNCIKQL